MAGEKKAVEMTMDTFNQDMGGRLREGHVYEMAPEYADHLMAQGLARTPTKRGREQTELTQEEEVAELEARLAALRGHSPELGVSSQIMGAPSREPSPVVLSGNPVVARPVTAQTRTAAPTRPEGGSIGTPATDSMDLTGEVHPGTSAPPTK